MSGNQEKERRIRLEKKGRESSVSRKSKVDEIGDRRPIISQEKVRATAGSVRERGKGKNEKPRAEKTHKRTGEIQGDRKREKTHLERDGKASKERQEVDTGKMKRFKQVESKIGKDDKIDAIYVRDVLEKRGIKKAEGERSGREKGKERPTKGARESEVLRGKGKEGEEGKKVKSRRDRTRTRTLSPTEIKQLLPSKAADGRAGGDASAEMKSGKERREEEEDEEVEEDASKGNDEEYEDDFEEYDSSFEEDTEQSISNSGEAIADLESRECTSPEIDPWKKCIRKQELEAIKRSIEKENLELVEKSQSTKRLPEDDSDKENESRYQPNQEQLIDFSKASRKLKKTKKMSASRKRGEELLNMITLDAITYSVLEIPPIPYEEFMKAFGKSNTHQAHVQTNEDDLDEEIQTDEIVLSNKWTQNPAEYLGSRRKVSFILTKEERLGVGGDFPSEEEMMIQHNANALWKFLSWASQVVLVALEKKSGNFLSLENMPNHSKAMAFGDGFVSLNVSDIPFLKGRSITHLCVLSESSGRLLSVHVNKEKSFQKCMICIWSFRELSKPLRILMASNRVSSCCFGLNQAFALTNLSSVHKLPLATSSLCLWDLREPSAYHNRMSNSPEWSLQSPTYTTAGNLRETAHHSPIVAVRLLSKDEATSGFHGFTPMQICSLDKDGTIVIWTVIQLEKTQRNAPSDDLGLAHWGRVKLVKRSSFSVFTSLRDEIPGLYITCNDILINEAEDDGFYVANSLGSVHHCSAYGSPMKPKFYVPSKQDAIIETTCLELCPFNGNYFLVGCGDGTIRLHSRHQENPLICLNSSLTGDDSEAQVVSLTWMRMRPCVFFALDSLSRINIWDLGVSDMYPEISLVLTEKKISCMRLLPVSDSRQVPFIVIGTEGGSIEIHKLKKEYGCRSPSEVHNEMKMFLKYVSIL